MDSKSYNDIKRALGATEDAWLEIANATEHLEKCIEHLENAQASATISKNKWVELSRVKVTENEEENSHPYYFGESMKEFILSIQHTLSALQRTPLTELNELQEDLDTEVTEQVKFKNTINKEQTQKLQNLEHQLEYHAEVQNEIKRGK